MQSPDQSSETLVWSNTSGSVLAVRASATSGSTPTRDMTRVPASVSVLPESYLVAGDAVDLLPEDVRVPVVPRVFLDHVEIDPAEFDLLIRVRVVERVVQ